MRRMEDRLVTQRKQAKPRGARSPESTGLFWNAWSTTPSRTGRWSHKKKLPASLRSRNEEERKIQHRGHRNFPAQYGSRNESESSRRERKERVFPAKTAGTQKRERPATTKRKRLEKRERIHFGGLGVLGGSNCMVRTMPSPSLTKITWFGLMSFKVSTRPLGQRISRSSTFAALPMPKWTRKSF